MTKYTKKDFEKLNANIFALTQKSAPEYGVTLFDTKQDFAAAVYGDLSYIPAYMNVKIDFEHGEIYTCDKENINLYIFYLIHGRFCAIHKAWLELLRCFAKFGFAGAKQITVTDFMPYPRLLFAADKKYEAAKAAFFAEMCEKHGFLKMLEWNETVDLIFYYPYVFGIKPADYIKPHDVSRYGAMLHGEGEREDETAVALWIDGKYRAESRLDVFYSDGFLTKAAIRVPDSVVGFADITPFGVSTYVADYGAWERRRASGYARNNPYDEQDFLKKVLGYCPAANPRILEIGIGGGRIAKPFVEAGIEYHGIDISDAMMEECRAKFRGYPNLHLKKHNAYAGIPFEDAYFDIVIECRAMGADNDPFIMQEIKRALKSGGTAILNIGDNWEEATDFTRKTAVLWNVYKDAYYHHYNIPNNMGRPQKHYGLALPAEPDVPKKVSTFVPPNPAEIYDNQNPFSVCEYDFDLLENLRDNVFHRAFFRREPLFEPCGTEFFKAMLVAAKKSLDQTTGRCVRKTGCKVYRF